MKKRIFIILIVLLLATLAITSNANTTSLSSDMNFALSGSKFEYTVANGSNDTGAHVIINRVYDETDYDAVSKKIYVNTGTSNKDTSKAALINGKSTVDTSDLENGYYSLLYYPNDNATTSTSELFFQIHPGGTQMRLTKHYYEVGDNIIVEFLCPEDDAYRDASAWLAITKANLHYNDQAGAKPWQYATGGEDKSSAYEVEDGSVTFSTSGLEPGDYKIDYYPNDGLLGKVTDLDGKGYYMVGGYIKFTLYAKGQAPTEPNTEPSPFETPKPTPEPTPEPTKAPNDNTQEPASTDNEEPKTETTAKPTESTKPTDGDKEKVEKSKAPLFILIGLVLLVFIGALVFVIIARKKK